MRYIVVLMVVAMLFGFQRTVRSQEKINQDVKVIKAYTPSVSDAYKINYLPSLGDSTAVKPRFKYSILSKSVVTDYQPSSIAPARINTKRKEYLDKSYAKGGVGNYSTVLGELGYNILQSEKYLLGLNIGHITSLGNVELEDDHTVDAPFHDTWAAANFKHFFDDKTLSIDMGFLHNKYRYYGYQTLDPEMSYLTTEGSLLGENLMHDKNQRLSGFDISIGLMNNEADKRKTSYDVKAGYNTFGNLTGVSQNGFLLSGSMQKPVNDLLFGLDAVVESYRTGVPDSIGPMYDFNDRGLTLISLNPSVILTSDNASLKVGMVVAGVIDTEGDELYVMPDFFGEINVAEGVVSLYGGITGDVNLNDYRSVVYENPFASADVNVKSSLYGLNLLGGIKGSFSSSTSFSAGVEYSIFTDEHFWVNKQYNAPTYSPVDEHYSNLFDVKYDGGSLLTVKGEMLFHPKKDMEIKLDAAYYGWNLDELEAAWHKPEMKLGAEARFMILDNLNINAGFAVLGERKAYDTEAENNQKVLDSVFDINIGAEYVFSKRWTFWADLNNIAASKYYKWNGYPMQGFNAKAGFTFSF